MSAVRAMNGGRITVMVGHGLCSGRTLPQLSWGSHADDVIDAIDALRIAKAPQMPGEVHEAVARLQQAMSPHRCTVLTRTIDGLLLKAAAADVLELDGSLWRLRCAADPVHPRPGVFGRQNRGRRCATCGSALRPDVRLPGEPPDLLADARAAVRASRVLLSVEADPTDPLMQELLAVAREGGVRCWEVHPDPSPSLFDESFPGPAEHGVPQLVGRWLGEEAA